MHEVIHMAAFVNIRTYCTAWKVGWQYKELSLEPLFVDISHCQLARIANAIII